MINEQYQILKNKPPLPPPLKITQESTPAPSSDTNSIVNQLQQLQTPLVLAVEQLLKSKPSVSESTIEDLKEDLKAKLDLKAYEELVYVIFSISLKVDVSVLDVVTLFID